MNTWKKAAALCWALVGLALPAQAFKLVPMAINFDASGSGANQSFRVENDSAETIAVQISMLKRMIDEDGKEQNSESEDFIVHPEQFLLHPKQTQIIRVRWIGSPKPSQELAFRILAEQVPVDLTKKKREGGRVDILLRYLGSVYVVAKGAKPDVVLEEVKAEPTEKGSRNLVLLFHNRGAAHVLLRELRLHVEAGGKSLDLDAGKLKDISGENLLPGCRRRFVLPWPDQLPEGTPTVTFEYERQ
jgi:fimbrial chaperone protein